MKYFGLIIALISLILFMFVALVLVYSSDSIGLSVMIGAMIYLFVVNSFTLLKMRLLSSKMNVLMKNHFIIITMVVLLVI